MSLAEKERKLRHVKKAKNFKKTIAERTSRREAVKEVREYLR